MASLWKRFPTAFLIIFLAATLQVATGAERKTLLISMDGFRWDYVDKTYTPNFDKFIREGAHVRQVTNAFATLTMPNHWTLVTGVYEEDHGIIANKFFDTLWNDTYSFSTDSKWYNNTEPIWITAEKEKKRSGAFMWIGNQAEYNGLTATKLAPFKSGTEFEDALDIATEWLASDDLDLVCLYTDQPDKDGHSYGPNSDEVKLRLRKIDAVLGDLMTRFDERDLTDKVNILLVADHGMADVSNSRTIDLSNYINFKEDTEWSYASAVGLIIPKPGKEDEVYNKLKAAEATEPHMTVYRKADIPEELKYKNNRRIPPIVVVAENGWLLKKGSYKISLNGNHGFDNKHPDMKTTFLARGPDFKCGYKQDAMRSVDVYPLLCHLLNLQTCHQSQGSLENTRNLLSDVMCVPSADRYHESSAHPSAIASVTLLFLTAIPFII